MGHKAPSHTPRGGPPIQNRQGYSSLLLWVEKPVLVPLRVSSFTNSSAGTFAVPFKVLRRTKSDRRSVVLFYNWVPRPQNRILVNLRCSFPNFRGAPREFHLRSSPSAFSEYMDVSQPADHFIACYTVLTRPNKVETAVHGCNLAFSLDSIMSLPR